VPLKLPMLPCTSRELEAGTYSCVLPGLCCERAYGGSEAQETTVSRAPPGCGTPSRAASCSTRVQQTLSGRREFRNMKLKSPAGAFEPQLRDPVVCQGPGDDSKGEIGRAGCVHQRRAGCCGCQPLGMDLLVLLRSCVPPRRKDIAVTADKAQKGVHSHLSLTLLDLPSELLFELVGCCQLLSPKDLCAGAPLERPLAASQCDRTAPRPGGALHPPPPPCCGASTPALPRPRRSRPELHGAAPAGRA
jgi:hypothetical protein